MTPREALIPANNLQHNCHARAGTTADEKGTERLMVPVDMIRCGHAGLALRSSNLWCHEPVTELDPEPSRHQGLSPAACRQPSTQGKVITRGLLPAHFCMEVCHGCGFHPWRRAGCAQAECHGMSDHTGTDRATGRKAHRTERISDDDDSPASAARIPVAVGHCTISHAAHG